MLTGEEIKDLGLVEQLNEGNLRGVSYDLSVGSIVTADGKVHESHVLKRQGIVKVVSKEGIKLPSDVCGSVIIKTGMSEKGLLAINIGLIDPLYEGNISSYLVNFSDSDQLISNGDHFLRASFHKMSQDSKYNKSVKIAKVDYINKSKAHMVSGFSDSFLNSEKIIQKFLDESIKKYRNIILSYASAAGFILALIVLFLNFGNLFIVHRWLDPQAAMKANDEKDVLAEQAALRDQNEKLRSTLDALEARLQKMESKK